MSRSAHTVRPAAVKAAGWGWQHAGRGVPAVHSLDLDIAPGEKVLLLGPSGAGKSTLLHALAGVLSGDNEHEETGRLSIDGAAPAQVRGRVGLMQQDPEAQVVLSRVGDDVAFGAENLSVPQDEIWRRVNSSLAAVGLNLPLDAPTSKLSGGQKQRLGLAGLLAMQPGLLLLDEPTANLDPDGVRQVRNAVERVLEETGATMVVVEHRVAIWADLVDRIIVLGAGGGVLIDGDPQEVLQQARRMLCDAGVWVPGWVPSVRNRINDGGGELLLHAGGLSVSRDKARRRHPAVPVAERITASVHAGRALSVTGPNGAGKSTFALTLAGLLPPAAGELRATAALLSSAGRAKTVRRAGEGAADSRPYSWRADELVGRIGTVFQEPEHQFITGRVYDELAFGPRRLGRQNPARGISEAALAARVDELLERLRLTGLAEANPFTLSGGEKRRLSVATVLAASPSVLVLDEPTFGQDALTWAELASLLTELLDAGTAVVSVSHDAEFTEALGGDRLHMEQAPHRSAQAAV